MTGLRFMNNQLSPPYEKCIVREGKRRNLIIRICAMPYVATRDLGGQLGMYAPTVNYNQNQTDGCVFSADTIGVRRYMSRSGVPSVAWIGEGAD